MITRSGKKYIKTHCVVKKNRKFKKLKKQNKFTGLDVV